MVLPISLRLKGRYPMIRFDLTDSNKETPIFDNFYIDFNALVYQCIRVHMS
jgi:5'-3' exonuclease